MTFALIFLAVFALLVLGWGLCRAASDGDRLGSLSQRKDER